MHALTASGRAIITQEQKTLELINKYIIWVSALLFTSGSLLLFWSITKWKDRQSVLDSMQNEDLRAKRFQNLTIEEKREQIVEENNIEEPTDNNISPVIEKTKVEDLIKEATNNTISKILDVENRLYNKISRNSSTKYNSLQNVKIGDIEYDIVLESRFKMLRDRIIEIRFFTKKLSKSNFTTSMHKTYLSKLNYEKQTSRKGLGLLIVALDSDDWEANKLLLESWFKGHSISSKINLVVLNVSEIESMDIIQKRIISRFAASG